MAQVHGIVHFILHILSHLAEFEWLPCAWLGKEDGTDHGVGGA